MRADETEIQFLICPYRAADAVLVEYGIDVVEPSYGILSRSLIDDTVLAAIERDIQFLGGFDSVVKKYLKEIAKFCKKHGAKLVLISTPSTKNWNYQRHNAMEAVSKDLGVDYIDTNLLRDDIPIDWKKDTKDKGDHLNYKGAVKVTNYIGKYLDDTKLFKDKRNDPSYDNWNTCLDKFEKKVKKVTS